MESLKKETSNELAEMMLQALIKKDAADSSSFETYDDIPEGGGLFDSYHSEEDSEKNDLEPEKIEKKQHEEELFWNERKNIGSTDKAGNHTYKLTYGPDLIEQVENKIKAENYPLYVAEANFMEKLKKIRNNDYLRNAYYSLRNSQGVIFTFGISFVFQSLAHKLFLKTYSTAVGILESLLEDGKNLHY